MSLNDLAAAGREFERSQQASPNVDPVVASQTATTGGRKFDAGKLLYGLLPPLALEENVKVLTFGAQKYEPDNWRRVPNGIERYFDAAQRHLWAWKQGQTYDQETGLHHMAHAICCLQFIADLQLADAKRQQDATQHNSSIWTGNGPGVSPPVVATNIVRTNDQQARVKRPD